MKFIVTLTGPSGSGKTTLENELIRVGVAARVLGFTTRDLRVGEIDGVDVHKISRQEGHAYYSDPKTVQKIEYAGNYYGKRLSDFEEAFAKSDVVTCVVTPQGIKQIRDYFQEDPDVVVLSYFVTAPTNTLIARLLTRVLSEEEPDLNYHAQRIKMLIKHDSMWGETYKRLFQTTLISEKREDTKKLVQQIADRVYKLRCAYM